MGNLTQEDDQAEREALAQFDRQRAALTIAESERDAARDALRAARLARFGSPIMPLGGASRRVQFEAISEFEPFTSGVWGNPRDSSGMGHMCLPDDDVPLKQRRDEAHRAFDAASALAESARQAYESARDEVEALRASKLAERMAKLSEEQVAAANAQVTAANALNAHTDGLKRYTLALVAIAIVQVVASLVIAFAGKS